jgi:ACS family glucarate transporter-like MFS transporter
VTATPALATTRPAVPRLRVRWKIFLFLFGFALIGYLQHTSFSVAGVPMMQELHLSEQQLSWLFDAFVLGYTILQFPGGLLGQRLGARLTFVLIGLLAVAAMLLTPLAPLLFSGAALLAVLLLAQFLLGVAQAPIFPVSTGMIEAWFMPRRWPLVQGVQSMGLQFGAALAPLLIAPLMSAFGWQRALVWTTLPALGVIAWWAWYARNTPTEHRGVSAAELTELGATAAAPVGVSISWARVRQLLRDRDVLLLTLSYLCMNYVYYLLSTWVFLYLVQERHFTVLESGLLAAAPPLAAAVGAGVGGWGASALSRRLGVNRGLKIIPLLSLPAAGVLQYLAVDAVNAYMAVVALSVCYACVELNEGSYWAAIMHVARADSMAASGLLNTGGNIGGLIGIPIIGYFAAHHAWTAAFILGTALAFVSAAAWLVVDPERGSRAGAAPPVRG